jgi:GH24 family phage-related lysozyme (muramidase)
MALSPEALALIRQWKGCRLVAYPDPASGGEPWTIGYGHTGPEVTAWLRISREQAERWLADDLAAAEAAVVRLLQPPAGLSQRQREALTSFCFNVGAGALAGSTLRRRPNGGEPVARVLEEELPRWVKGPHGPVAGLVQRRRAELAFSNESAPAIRYAEGGAITLKVPYFSQLDSVTGQGPRMCFSSTCAMAGAFLKPGCLAGEGQMDDRYLALVQLYGDSTEAHAQARALDGRGAGQRLVAGSQLLRSSSTPFGHWRSVERAAGVLCP